MVTSRKLHLGGASDPQAVNAVSAAMHSRTIHLRGNGLALVVNQTVGTLAQKSAGPESLPDPVEIGRRLSVAVRFQRLPMVRYWICSCSRKKTSKVRSFLETGGETWRCCLSFL